MLINVIIHTLESKFAHIYNFHQVV